MSETLNIVKILFKGTYRTSKSESGGGKTAVCVAIAVFYLLFETALIITFAQMTPIFINSSLVPELLTAVITIGLLAVSAIGIVPMLSLLYFSSDSEFFLALPVSPVKVYFAKLISVYVVQFALTFAFTFPVLVSIGIAAKLNAFFYVVTLFAQILLPVFPLTVLSIICLPLMYLLRFLKNRGAIASVVVLILFVAFFVFYMFAVTSAGYEEADVFALVTNKIVKIADVFVPFLAINRFATFTVVGEMSLKTSMFVNFVAFVIPAAVLSFVSLLISKAAYTKAVAAQLENPRKILISDVYKAETGINKAIIQREFKEILRTPAFLLQCFAGLIIAPILFVVMAVKGEFSGIGLAESVELETCFVWLLVAVMIATLVISVNIGAATTISRDGKCFYIAKLIPVSYDVQINARIKFYKILYGADIFLCVALQYISCGFVCWWVGILLLVFLLALNDGFVSMCVALDLSNPKLDWKSYNEIVKRSRNAMLPTIIGIGISALIAIGGIVALFVLSSLTSVVVASIIVCSVLIALAVVFAMVMKSILNKNIQKYFERIDG